MAYSDFTFAKLQLRYGIEQEDAYMFEGVSLPTVSASQKLLEDIQEAKETPLMTEKAKSEAIIAPIMRELKRHNPHITIFSGYTFNIETDKELNGAPDFLISAKSKLVEPKSPIFCLFESKNKAPEEGFAQCASEMYAAQLFNEQMNEPVHVIYGAVTNAFEWIFMKLENKTIYIDKDRYFLNDLPTLLGILQYIVNQK
ncbi:MAG: hypothetical protein EAZ95_06270 [Bacteroidetes bacterium]|nr:MAG: hypothetical protein EAZ95_06270 [Bacteroidota bacterium]